MLLPLRLAYEEYMLAATQGKDSKNSDSQRFRMKAKLIQGIQQVPLQALFSQPSKIKVINVCPATSSGIIDAMH